jgi:hypothetical protein
MLPPSLSDLARTSKRLQARQPLGQAMFARGEHANPAPSVQELKRAPKPGSVTTGMTATRITRQKPRGR